MRRVSRIGLGAALVFGCDVEADAPAMDTVELGKADGLGGSASISAPGLSVWFSTTAVPEERDGEPVLVVQGRTSKNLAGVASWVPDDAFGTTTIVSPRRFEIVLRGGHEINSILSGLPLFVDIETSTGSIRRHTARIELAANFARFDGDAELWVDSSIAPVYVRDEIDPLRYRGSATTSAPADGFDVFTDDDSDPLVTRVDDRRWRFDWTYAGFALAFDPPTDPVHFSASIDGADFDKRAGIDLRVRAVGLTNLDPRTVWPDPVCEPEVFECVAQTPASEPDLGHCGSYREVARCVFADACEVLGSSPLSLAPLDTDAAEPARAVYLEDCSSGGQWCDLQPITAYAIPVCLDPEVSLETIVDEVLAQEQQPQGEWLGEPFTREQLSSTPQFGTAYSEGGPQLLEALDAFAGSTDLEAWVAVQEVPCHNCSEFWDKLVLWYPSAGVVLELDGVHGYDS